MARGFRKMRRPMRRSGMRRPRRGSTFSRRSGAFKGESRMALMTKSVDYIAVDPANPTAALALSFTTTPATPSGFICLNRIAAGSGEFQRIGRKIKLVSLLLNFAITPTGAASQARSQESIRMLVVYDRQPNGLQPLITDILLDQRPEAGSTQTTPYSSSNIDNSMRFKILKDWKIELPATFANGTDAVTGISGFDNTSIKYGMNFKAFVKLRGLETTYKADNATPLVGDIAVGALWFIGFSDVLLASVQTQISSPNFTARLKFLDR